MYQVLNFWVSICVQVYLITLFKKWWSLYKWELYAAQQALLCKDLEVAKVDFEVYNSFAGGSDTVLRSVIINNSLIQSEVLFGLSFASSIISASLGTTKCLKVGVSAPIGEVEGSARFLVAFFGKYIFLSQKQLYIHKCLLVSPSITKTHQQLEIINLHHSSFLIPPPPFTYILPSFRNF